MGQLDLQLNLYKSITTKAHSKLFNMEKDESASKILDKVVGDHAPVGTFEDATRKAMFEIIESGPWLKMKERLLEEARRHSKLKRKYVGYLRGYLRECFTT